MHTEAFNEVMIAKQEKMIKAYTQKYHENLDRMDRGPLVKSSVETQLVEF